MHRTMGSQSMIEAFLPEQVGRNETEMWIKCMAYKLRRAEWLVFAG